MLHSQLRLRGRSNCLHQLFEQIFQSNCLGDEDIRSDRPSPRTTRRSHIKLFGTNPPLPSDEVVEFRGVRFSEEANKATSSEKRISWKSQRVTIWRTCPQSMSVYIGKARSNVCSGSCTIQACISQYFPFTCTHCMYTQLGCMLTVQHSEYKVMLYYVSTSIP